MNEYTGKTLTIKEINLCSRCGGQHKDLEARPLTNPHDDYEHFAMCPTLNEPISVKITT